MLPGRKLCFQAHLAKAGQPFVIGGDFNFDEKEVQDLIEEEGAPALVNVPEGWTCKGKDSKSRIDFSSSVRHCRRSSIRGQHRYLKE